MASGGRQFDDSSGTRTRPGYKISAPKDLELKEMHSQYVTRWVSETESRLYAYDHQYW